MRIYNNDIPATHLSQNNHPVPPEAIVSDVTIYAEALDYIKCEMTNTIRHESAHRSDEEERRESDFSAFSEEGRAEPIAEAAERDCSSFYPQEISTPQTVNVSQIFDECKSASGVDPAHLSDVKAVVLDDNKLGLYYMQELPGMYDFQEGEMRRKNDSGFDYIEGWDGSQYINVARHFRDWMIEDDTQTYKPNVQTDGTEVDPDQIQQSVAPINAAPSTQSVPSIPSVESR